jgi:GNAT superfamily N-acetyltransferase
MSDPWSIRAARSTDAAEIARLATLLGYPSAVQAIVERLGSLQRSADHWIAVACPLRAAPALSGWMHVARRATLESGEFAELLGLVVDGSVRRGGVGRALVAEAERWSRLQRLARLTVRSNATRTESHEFYPALGFARVKTQQVYSKLLGADAAGAA